MPTFDVPKLYKDEEDLYEAHLDAAFEYIEGALNTTKLDSANIQSAGIIAANLASGIIDESKLALSSVTTTRIKDANVTAAKLAANAVETTAIKDANVTASKLAANAVETAAIKDGAVTQAKRVALGQQVSASSGAFGTNSLTFVDVPNLSVSITPTGRPVMVMLQPDGTATTNLIGSTTSSILVEGSGNVSNVVVYRGTTMISMVSLGTSSQAQAFYPPGVISFIDTGATADVAHTYKIAVATGGTGTVFVKYAKLVAYEL